MTGACQLTVTVVLTSLRSASLQLKKPNKNNRTTVFDRNLYSLKASNVGGNVETQVCQRDAAELTVQLHPKLLDLISVVKHHS